MKPRENRDAIQNLIKATYKSKLEFDSDKKTFTCESKQILETVLTGLQLIQESPFKLLSLRAGEVHVQIETRSAAYLKTPDQACKDGLLKALGAARELADIDNLLNLSNWSKTSLCKTFSGLKNKGYIKAPSR